jgi:hypothetical protein
MSIYLTDSTCGPAYNIDSAALKKFRREARDGLTSLSRDDRQAYAAAIVVAVLAAQRSTLRGAAYSMPAPRCASGTTHTTGKAIVKAIRQRQRAALLACPDQIRAARKPHEWQKLYDEAMREKRARLAMRVAA